MASQYLLIEVGFPIEQKVIDRLNGVSSQYLLIEVGFPIQITMKYVLGQSRNTF